MPIALNEPYEPVVPYCTCESALRLVCHVMRAVEVPTDAVSVLEIASAGAGGVEVAACDELLAVEVDVFVGGVGSGSGSGVGSVVNVSSAVKAALPEESITITR